jgi:hypothetical protein
MIIGIDIRDEYQNDIVSFVSDEMGTTFKNEHTNTCYLEIPNLMLRGGSYNLRLFAAYKNTRSEDICDSIENAAILQVISSDFWRSGKIIRSGKQAVLPAKYKN